LEVYAVGIHAGGGAPTELKALDLLLTFILIVGPWLLLARSDFLQGEDMERPNRVAQLYGYAVCLIAVVVFLVSANNFVDNAFALANPLRARGNQFGMEPAISSFDAYRGTVGRERPGGGPGNGAAPALPDSVLRVRYEALRADRIEQSRFDAERGLTTSGLLLVLSIVLFLLHWRWLRSVAARQTTTA
jgi:hypothetical protein